MSVMSRVTVGVGFCAIVGGLITCSTMKQDEVAEIIDPERKEGTSDPRLIERIIKTTKGKISNKTIGSEGEESILFKGEDDHDFKSVKRQDLSGHIRKGEKYRIQSSGMRFELLWFYPTVQKMEHVKQ